jgi:4-amino-4-deoxychorismate lyase
MYGLGVFETFRTYSGHPFLLHDHIRRLNKALAELNITKRFAVKEAAQLVQDLLQKNGWGDAYIRFNVSAGIGEIGLQTESYEQPTVILYGKPLTSVPSAEKELVLLKTFRNTPEGEERIKSHHYLNSILGKRELADPLNQEGLFLTKEGDIAEGCVSNIFWMKDGTLFTSAVSTGILNGITRQFVLLMAGELNIPAEEGHYKKEELLLADEVFLTNSIQEIVPVCSFAGTRLPGRAGTMTGLLQKNFEAYKYSLLTMDDLRKDGQQHE